MCHEIIENIESESAHVGDLLRSVGRVRRITDIEEGFVGQLVLDRPSDRETAHSGVEDSNRCVSHSVKPSRPNLPASSARTDRLVP